ncbi:type VII secretion protein EccCa [Mycolicibacterium chitae]|uniref:type VII secretion protein EccCa n=1 Tax=Mycolicibacterium chitae TaxID=1792 RepID=UPI001F48C1C6|nr:type VII secretion protein EccCa [Mycolicibacterium chitae]
MVEITVSEPPALPRDTRGWARNRWLPVLGLVAGAGVMVALGVGGAPLPQHNPAMLAFPVIMIVSTLTSLAYGVGAGGNAKLDRDRDDYLDYLDRTGADLAEAAARQQVRSAQRHPDPDALWAAVGTPAMWRCRPGDADFGRLRIGRGDVTPDTRPVRAPRPDDAQGPQTPDPVTESALREFLAAYATVPGLPVTIDLPAAGVVAVRGASADAAALARSMICQLAVSHGPGEVAIAVVAGPSARRRWDWIKWLPHNRHPAPMFCRDLAEAGQLGTDRRLLVVLDAAGVPAATPPMCVLVMGGSDAADLELTVTPQQVAACRADGAVLATATPDLMGEAQALTCARRLTRHRDDAGRRPDDFWSQLMNRAHRPLRIPIGTTPGGEAVDLDIRESAAGGIGPHGLCIGATGSGKSELLRTVALGMIAGHSSEELNLILVDFKGGATFLGLERAQHVSAVITNLADEAYLVERMQEALTGELQRRQRVLREAGNLGGVDAYRRARADDRSLPPLPTLLVIVDEFAELLSQHPEFVDVFVAIGRLGRSLGVHLLLASQRLEEGRLRGLESHLSYRICLKTLSAGESRAVLGVADAYELPAAPGSAYLKAGAGEPLRFRAVTVSGPAPAPAPGPEPVRTVTEFTAEARRPEPVAPPPAGTLLDAVLDAVEGRGPAAHRVWLPPLPHSPSLDALLSDVAAADLRVPIGQVDRVFDQRREPLMVDLSGAAGHVAVVGAPQSGKSAALRTLALALAATHTPRRIQLYGLDFGGGALGPLRGLPHVGAVAARRDVELARRIVTDLTALLRRREILFARHGLDSIAEYRRRRADGTLGAEDPFGDVFLIVDGWAALRQERDDLELAITNLAAEGLSLGVHVVLAASRWADLRPALRDQIGTRIELRLADPIDSEVDRRAARSVPAQRPGRGLAPDGSALTLALPRLDGAATAAGLAEATAAAGAALTARHPGHRAPATKVLPHLVDRATLPHDTGPGRRVTLGLDEAELRAVVLDFDVQPHLLILGDRGCGKTATLRGIAQQLGGPDRLIVVDPRRTLTAPAGATHVVGEAALTALVAEAVPRLRHGAAGHVFILIDDADLTSAGALAPLVEFLPASRDIGLHLVIARPAAGAARALYEPFLAAVRHSDAMGLQMSAAADEGPLLGSTRPAALPPGRGVLSTRAGGEQLVQVAWSAP